MLFFGRFWPKFRQHWIFEVAKTPIFFTFSAKYRPFLDEKYAFFFLGPFWTYFITKKIWGSSGHFSPFFGIFGKNNKFSTKFANFWSKSRFLRFFSKFQVEIASRVCVVRRGLRYGKDFKIFELSENLENFVLRHSPRPPPNPQMKIVNF